MLAFVLRDVGRQSTDVDAESSNLIFLVGDSDPDMVGWHPFPGIDGAGEGLAGGSTSWIVKIRLPLQETLVTCSTSLTFNAFLTFIIAREGRMKNQQENPPTPDQRRQRGKRSYRI